MAGFVCGENLQTNWELSGCLRRRRLAFPTGKVARPLAVTDESQNAAYFLQPNWNGSIVHLTAHKQSRFQLTRLAARATLPAREGKCALRAQDAHLYKSPIWRGGCAAGALPLPMGEVPPMGAERALSVTAYAVPAPPKGEPSRLLNL